MNRLMNQLMNRFARLGVILALLASSTGALAASIDKERVSQLKGVWVARLTGFTSWPKRADSINLTASPITIGLLGRDPNGVIDVIRQRMGAPGGLSANGRQLRLMDLNTSAGALDLVGLAEQLKQCDVLFLSEDAFVQWSALQPLVESQPILTVGESDGFAEGGGVVEIYPDPKEDVMVMRINLQAMRRSGVELSAKILSLSNVVILDAEAEES